MKKKLKQCLYCPATQCLKDEVCDGCEIKAEYESTPVLRIVQIKENGDGTVDCEVILNQKAKEFVLTHYKRRRWSKKLLEKFLLEAMENTVNYYKEKGVI